MLTLDEEDVIKLSYSWIFFIIQLYHFVVKPFDLAYDKLKLSWFFWQNFLELIKNPFLGLMGYGVLDDP